MFGCHGNESKNHTQLAKTMCSLRNLGSTLMNNITHGGNAMSHFNEKNVHIKYSLYSRYYAEASNEWQGPSSASNSKETSQGRRAIRNSVLDFARNEPIPPTSIVISFTTAQTGAVNKKVNIQNEFGLI